MSVIVTQQSHFGALPTAHNVHNSNTIVNWRPIMYNYITLLKPRRLWNDNYHKTKC